MPGYDLTTIALASAIGVSRQTIHELLSEKRASLRSWRYGCPSVRKLPRFWLNAQQARDLGSRNGATTPT